ncbi:MAG: ZIP family metal transporter [Clostridia bacterium]|nr:ZIP family metal transporter [Clostridia bacterium]
MNFLEKIPTVWLALLAAVFCWLITALGAALVFFFKKTNTVVMNILMGFSAGVMIAASFWSLLSPAIDLSVELGYIAWLFPCIGFIAGGLFVVGASKLLDKSIGIPEDTAFQSKKRGILLVLSITLHNIPEGMSVGVAFGAFAVGTPGSTLMGALILALGIGLQNFPEGASVALPLRRDGMSRPKAFVFGQFSGLVEPIAAMLGYLLCTAIKTALPFCLSFSAGAMIAVVASELLPEASKENKHLATLGCIAGFTVMMLLDVALG